MSGALRPLAGAVERALRVLHLDVGVDRASAIDAWADAAEAVLGADGRSTRAVRVDGDTVVVVVPDSAWAGEIRLREQELLERLKGSAPRARIRRIRCAPASERRG